MGAEMCIRDRFALMVDFGHDCLVRDDHPGELDPRSQRIYAGDFLRELGVTQHCRVLVVSGVELLCEMLEELA